MSKDLLAKSKRISIDTILYIEQLKIMRKLTYTQIREMDKVKFTNEYMVKILEGLGRNGCDVGEIKLFSRKETINLSMFQHLSIANKKISKRVKRYCRGE